MHGVSTRKVDELMKALGLDGVSKSEVSRICGELDPLVEAFRTRALTTDYPYIWVDATYHKVRVNGRVTSQATVVAVGVTSEGERQVLGIDVGPSEDRAFWTAFLRSLVKRGLRGVRLVTSDAHEGLKQAIATVLSGATWQRCRVHFMRNLLATVPKGAREAIAAVVRTIFAQPDHATAMTQLRKVADGLRGRVCPGRRAARGRRRGHPGVPAPAARAPATAAQHESAGAAEQGDQAAVERRRDLPDAAVGHPPGRRHSARAGRRMGGGRAPLLQRGVDEAAHGADAAGDRAGDLRRDCVKEGIGVGACGNRSVVSKQRWTVLFRPRLRQRPRRGRTQGRRARFTPLDGTLPRPIDVRAGSLSPSLRSFFIRRM